MSGSRSALLSWLACLVLLASASGCRRFERQQGRLEALTGAGRYAEALELLDSPDGRAAYGGRNEILWHLERGAAALSLGDMPLALQELDAGESRADAVFQETPADAVASVLLSDAATTYLPTASDEIYANTFKLVAQLALGRIQGGATVEARRAARRADQLRDRHLSYRSVLQARAADVDVDEAPPGLEAVNPDGAFIESTLAAYLSAVVFMETGDFESQRVAARRLATTMRLHAGITPELDAEVYAGLDAARPADADLLVVALSGRGPTRRARRIGPWFISTVPVYVEFPVLATHPSVVERVEVEVDGVGTYGVPLVERFGDVAVENHRRELPELQLRAFLRAAAKAAGTAVAAEAARESAGDDHQGLAQLGVVLGGLFLLGVTEQADLRSWVGMPDRAHATTLDLPAGRHRARIRYRDRAGAVVYASDWTEIDTSAADLTTIVGRYWR